MQTREEKRAYNRLYRVTHRAEIYAYMNAWRKRNPEKVKADRIRYYHKGGKAWRDRNKSHLHEVNVKFRNSHPWYKTYYAIQARCYYPQCRSYPYYGGKGIQNFLSLNDLKMLWFRDKAYLMRKPSIDRTRTWDHYTMDNCTFIEMELNRKKDRKRGD